MAKSPTKPAAYDPAVEYRVKLRNPHHYSARRTFQPLHTYYLSGEVLASIPADVVLSAEPMPAFPETA